MRTGTGILGAGRKLLMPELFYRYARESGYLDMGIGRLATIFRLFFKGICIAIIRVVDPV
jgi:hypothetical protein